MKVSSQRAIYAQKRRSPRFAPNPNTLACIEFQNNSKGNAEVNTALVVSESHYGCGVLLIPTGKVEPGDLVKIAVGEKGAISAKVAWVRSLEGMALMVGFQFS